jgi:hypothetical protein
VIVAGTVISHEMRKLDGLQDRESVKG